MFRRAIREITSPAGLDEIYRRKVKCTSNRLRLFRGLLKSKWIEGREWKSERMSEDEEEWSTGGEGVSATVLF